MVEISLIPYPKALDTALDTGTKRDRREILCSYISYKTWFRFNHHVVKIKENCCIHFGEFFFLNTKYVTM